MIEHDTLQRLHRRLERATGPDRRLDRALDALLPRASDRKHSPAYTGSVEDCAALIEAAAPGCRQHVGFDARGILPYAALTRPGGRRSEASAPTVPLALLRALVLLLEPEPG